MNIVNRIVIVIALIATLVGVTAVCLFPDFFISQFSILSDWLVARTEPRVELIDHLYLIAVAAVVDIALLLFLALELRRPKAKSVRVQRVEGGTAMLTADSIRKRLAFYIDGLEDVVSVKPQVQIKRDTVSVAVNVQTSAAVNVPSKAREIVAIIRMVITETMGLKLRGEPQVQIRTGKYKDMPLPPAVPDTPALPMDEEE